MLVESLRAVFGNIQATLPTVVGHRLGDGNVVSCLHGMNDPPEGHMASRIGRRKFVATLGGAAAAWPLAARAQQPDRVRRIGVLINTVDNDPDAVARLSAFKKALRELGWDEG